MGCGGVSVLVCMWGSEFEVVWDGFAEAWVICGVSTDRQWYHDDYQSRLSQQQA